MKRVISTTAAPGAVGPYSQAVEANGFVFVSGQLPLDPATGAFVSDNTDEQAEQCIKNLLAVLAAAGCKAEDVVKATVFMIDIGEFSVVNEVYAKYFNGECPARCAMQVGQAVSRPKRKEREKHSFSLSFLMRMQYNILIIYHKFAFREEMR